MLKRFVAKSFACKLFRKKPCQSHSITKIRVCLFTHTREHTLLNIWNENIGTKVHSYTEHMRLLIPKYFLLIRIRICGSVILITDHPDPDLGAQFITESGGSGLIQILPRHFYGHWKIYVVKCVANHLFLYSSWRAIIFYPDPGSK